MTIGNAVGSLRSGSAIVAVILAATILLFAAAAQATTLNDGGTHVADASGPFDAVTLNAATTLNVLSGADILGAAASSFAEHGVYANQNSEVHVFGGSVRGGPQPGSGYGGFGVYTSHGSITVDGGFIRGGDNSGGGFGGFGINADFSTVTINAGTIRGGDRYGNPGFGGFGLVTQGSNVTINGGAIAGGAGFSGGLSMDGLHLQANSTARINNGSISRGGADSGWSVHVRHTSVLEILGGVFSGPMAIADNGVVHVYGTGLTYDGITLTGTLQSGTPIALPVSVFNDGQLILHQVPEPQTVALLGLGLLGLLVAGRHRRARS